MHRETDRNVDGWKGERVGLKWTREGGIEGWRDGTGGALRQTDTRV